MLRIILSAVALACVGFVLTWYILPPSHDRQWQDDYAVLPKVRTDRDAVEIAGVRDWSYDPATGRPIETPWRTVSLRPDALDRVWFAVEPFTGSDAVAHTMLAFEFSDGRAVVASVEARREVGETYRPALAAVWPSYEYLVVWATERDMYANTVFAAEDRLFLYPLRLSDEMARGVFGAMVALTAEVREDPRWYNTAVANCTSVLARAMNDRRPGAVPLHVSWVLPGLAPEFLYDQGWLPDDLPFDALKAAAEAMDRVREVYPDAPAAEFPTRLRAAGSAIGA